MSMKPLLFDPDDPTLTAYALGELTDAAERAQVERLLADSPEARAALEEIRALAAALSAEYEQERALSQSETENCTQKQEAPAPNVIAMPAAGRPARGGSWMRPLLKMAAVLLVLGMLVWMALPVFNDAQVKGRMSAVRERVLPVVVPEKAPAAVAAATPPPNYAAAPPSPTEGLLAKNSVVEKVLEASTASKPAAASTPASASDSSLLAQTAPPAELAASDRNRSDNALMQRQQQGAALDSDLQAAAAPGAPPATAQPAARGEVRKAGPPASLNGSIAMEAGKDLAEAEQNTRRLAQRDAAGSPSKPKAVTVDDLGAPTLFMNTPDAETRSLEITSSAPSSSLAQSKKSGGGFGGGAGNEASRRERSAAMASAAAPVDGLAGAAPPAPNLDPSVPYPTQVQPPEINRGFGFRKGFPVTPTTPTGSAFGNGYIASSKTAPDDLADEHPIAGLRDKNKQSVNPGFNTAAYDHLIENAFLSAKENPLSTFSIDVDTASYSNVRRFIESGSLPPKDAVRIEELLNYFPYADAPPAPDNEKPFAIHLEAAACPWDTDHRLVRIGIKGREMARDKRPPSNLVFLLDVSGSMTPPERLPLIKESLRLMVEKLTEDDRVAIVVYAGASGLALPSTGGDHKERILSSLEKLRPGGSTNGASGIQLAYKVAQENFIKEGVNRVILATDGDFNVGVTNQGDLVRLIEAKAKSGVFLSVLGVGTDNLKDSTMQKLADRGNGNYAYIDRIEEGRKVLVEQMSGTLVTIAKDVKIQVEFNPARVAAYRLIGYEKRMLRKEDFNNDKIDAGEIGAGHSVTALYEIVPAGQRMPSAAVDALKYQQPPPAASATVREDRDKDESKLADTAVGSTAAKELLTVKMRHKAPASDKSERSYEEALSERDASENFSNASPDFKFAAAVASFGLVLRDSPYKGNATLGAAIELAQEGKGTDASGYRAGFIELARRAQALQGER